MAALAAARRRAVPAHRLSSAPRHPARRVEELALDDVGEVHRTESTADRVLGTSTIVVHPRRRGVRRSSWRACAAARSSRRCSSCSPAIRRRRATPTRSASALAWEPRAPARRSARGARRRHRHPHRHLRRRHRPARQDRRRHLRGRTMRSRRTARSGAAPRSSRFMEAEVMPWARATLGRLKGGRRSRDVRHVPRRGRPRRAAGGCRRSPRCRSPTCGIAAGKPTRPAWTRRCATPSTATSPNPTTRPRPRTCARSSCRAWRGSSIVRPTISRNRYEYNRTQHALGCYHCHQGPVTPRASVDRSSIPRQRHGAVVRLAELVERARLERRHPRRRRLPRSSASSSAPPTALYEVVVLAPATAQHPGPRRRVLSGLHAGAPRRQLARRQLPEAAQRPRRLPAGAQHRRAASSSPARSEAWRSPPPPIPPTSCSRR